MNIRLQHMLAQSHRSATEDEIRNHDRSERGSEFLEVSTKLSLSAAAEAKALSNTQEGFRMGQELVSTGSTFGEVITDEVVDGYRPKNAEQARAMTKEERRELAAMESKLGYAKQFEKELPRLWESTDELWNGAQRTDKRSAAGSVESEALSLASQVQGQRFEARERQETIAELAGEARKV